MTRIMKLDCTLAGRCSGCDWITRPYADQISEKAGRVGGTIAVRSIAAGGLRDRVDLIYRRSPDGMRLGLYEIGKKEPR